MRLDIGVLGSEKRLCPVDGKLFDHVDVLTSAVIPRAGIAFSVLVCQMTSHSLHDGAACEVFGCNKLNVIALTLQLPLHRSVKLGVTAFYNVVAHICLHIW